MTRIYDRDYSKVNQIININKMRFSFSDFESMVIKKMFLQLKLDIFSENDPSLEGFAKKKIKEDIKKQLEIFDKFYNRFKKCENYPNKQEAEKTPNIKFNL